MVWAQSNNIKFCYNKYICMSDLNISENTTGKFTCIKHRWIAEKKDRKYHDVLVIINHKGLL